MRHTLTVATLPAGPMLTQYGVRAPITLDSESLSYPGNYGRPHGWTDAHIPRTEKPVRFAWMPVVGYQLDADGYRIDGFASRVLA